VSSIQPPQQHSPWLKLGFHPLAVGGVLQHCEQQAHQLKIFQGPCAVIKLPARTKGMACTNSGKFKFKIE
jgi:hypothetical protein